MHILTKLHSIVMILLKVTEISRAEQCGVSPLHFAAQNDHVEIMENLLDAGYDVNHKMIPDKILYMFVCFTFFCVFNSLIRYN